MENGDYSKCYKVIARANNYLWVGAVQIGRSINSSANTVFEGGQILSACDFRICTDPPPRP